MKKYFALLLLVSGISFAQSVNDYKYVLVPSKFSFFKETDAYGLNSLTKGLLGKYGFVAYLDNDDIPTEILDSNCNKLYADVLEDNNIINTRLTVVLKDCKGKVLFTSQQGKSKDKDWRIGTNEALRAAFKSFDDLGYKYNGTVTEVKKEIVKTTNDGTSVKTETIAVNPSPQVIHDAPTLFAQPISGGYQLVDTTPKVVMKIFATGSKDMYLAEKGETKGVLRNDNGKWVFEYQFEGNLRSETLNVKF